MSSSSMLNLTAQNEMIHQVPNSAFMYEVAEKISGVGVEAWGGREREVDEGGESGEGWWSMQWVLGGCRE